MLNSNLDDVCALIGYTPTRILAAWYCGRNLYVPQIADPKHPLATLLGDAAFRRLVSLWQGPRQVWIPTGEEDSRYGRDRRIAELIANGMTDEQIADQHQLTRVRIVQLRLELTASGWVDFARPRRKKLGTGEVFQNPAYPADCDSRPGDLGDLGDR